MLADQFDAFLFDLDGVVHVGPDPLPNAVEALTRLRRRGKALRFLTNDPRPTRAEVVDRLTAMGVQAELGDRHRRMADCGVPEAAGCGDGVCGG